MPLISTEWQAYVNLSGTVALIVYIMTLLHVLILTHNTGYYSTNIVYAMTLLPLLIL